MSSLIPKKLQYIQYIQWRDSVGLQKVTLRYLCFLLVRFLEIDAPQSPKFSKTTCLYSSLLKTGHFSKILSGSSHKKPFSFFFLTLGTINHKNCETSTTFPLIQCWLEVCFLIPCHHRLAQLFQTWHNIEPGDRRNYKYLWASQTNFRTFSWNYSKSQ